MRSNILWVLGAPSPKTNFIERLLTAAGETVAYAVSTDGERVWHASAYQATGLRVEDGPVGESCPLDTRIVWVECGMSDGAGGTQPPREGDVVIRHRTDLPLEKFFAASCLGQVISEMAKLGGRLANISPAWRGGYQSPAREVGDISKQPQRDAVPTPWCVTTSSYAATHRSLSGCYYAAGLALEIPDEVVAMAYIEHCRGIGRALPW